MKIKRQSLPIHSAGQFHIPRAFFTLALLFIISGLIQANTAPPIGVSAPVQKNANDKSSPKKDFSAHDPAGTLGAAPGQSADTDAMLVVKPGSRLWLHGNSTLHEYEIAATSILSSVVLKPTAGKASDILTALQEGGVREMALDIPVSFLKSHETLMDTNTYGKLKAKKNPDILFVLKSQTVEKGPQEGSWLIHAKGDLTVAGVTQETTLDAKAAITDEGVRLTGVKQLKMKDFKIDPPVMMMVISTSNEVDIHFDLLYGMQDKKVVTSVPDQAAQKEGK